MTTNPSLSIASCSCQQCRDAHRKCEFKSDQAKCNNCLVKDLECDKVNAPGQRRKVQKEIQEKMREESGIMTSVLRFSKKQSAPPLQEESAAVEIAFEELPEELRDIGVPHNLLFVWSI